MIIEATTDLASRTVSLLSTHDFAFVKRSDGSYSFAILAYRSMDMDPIRGGAEDEEGMEECMNFVVSEGGSTKMVRERRWVECVRLVSMDGSCCDPATGVCSCQKVVPMDAPALCEEVEHNICVD